MDAPPAGFDTPRDVEQRMIELWRACPAAAKLRKVFGIGAMVNELARAELRSRYPNATERELELRLASRTLDRETMIKAFGWDPELHGR